MERRWMEKKIQGGREMEEGKERGEIITWFPRRRVTRKGGGFVGH
jgi:hypothetical protein